MQKKMLTKTEVTLAYFTYGAIYLAGIIQGAAEIVKHFKILVKCFSVRVSRSAGV